MDKKKLQYLQQQNQKLSQNQLDIQRHNKLIDVYNSVNRQDYDEYPYEQLEKRMEYDQQYIAERCYPPGKKSSNLLDNVLQLMQLQLSLKNQKKLNKMETQVKKKKKKQVQSSEESESESSEEEVIVQKKKKEVKYKEPKKEKEVKRPKMDSAQIVSLARQKITSDPMFNML